jgi:hypothetical protein
MTTHHVDEFPLGETTGCGRYRIVSNLFGSGADRLDLAVDAGEPDARFLVSSTYRQVPAELHQALAYRLPSVFDVVFTGTLDERGDDLRARSMRTQQTAVVERLPPGSCLRHLITGALEPIAAVTLAVEVGRILVAAANAGQLLARLRPETIWARQDCTQLRVTGLSDRSERLFRAAKRICYTVPPPFERRYTAPEVVTDQRVTDRTLSFILGILVAEWVTGQHPFPEALCFGDASSIVRGAHAPIDAPPALRALIGESLRVAPLERPDLSSMVRCLEALSI